MITPFHEKPRSEVCPSFVRMQGNQVVSGKVQKSRNCPEFVFHIFEELCQKMKTSIGQKVDLRTKTGFEEDKSWIYWTNFGRT